MRIASFVIALGVLALSATKVAAQTCLGAASFSSGLLRVGAGMGTSDGAKSYGVDMAVGAKSGGYVSGGLSRLEYSDIDGSAKSVALGAGYLIGKALRR